MASNYKDYKNLADEYAKKYGRRYCLVYLDETCEVPALRNTYQLALYCQDLVAQEGDSIAYVTSWEKRPGQGNHGHLMQNEHFE